MNCAILNPEWMCQIRLMPNIIENPYMIIKGDQFRFPQSKKKRIRAKWSKREVNFRLIPDPQVYAFENKYICHPQTARRYRNELRQKGFIDSGIITTT